MTSVMCRRRLTAPCVCWTARLPSAHGPEWHQRLHAAKVRLVVIAWLEPCEGMGTVLVARLLRNGLGHLTTLIMVVCGQARTASP